MTDHRVCMSPNNLERFGSADSLCMRLQEMEPLTYFMRMIWISLSLNEAEEAAQSVLAVSLKRSAHLVQYWLCH